MERSRNNQSTLLQKNKKQTDQPSLRERYNQYALSKRTRHLDQATLEEQRARDEAKLHSTFCPPLDPSLIQAIWNDSFDYDASFEILTSLAKEAEKVLDQQDELTASLNQLDLSNTMSTDLSLTESEDENVNFLFTCFPTTPVEDLIEALRSQENDLEKAIDILLSKEYIQNNPDDLSPPQKKKKPQKQKKQIWSSGQLPTVSTTLGNTTNTAATANNMRRIKESEERKYDSYADMASVPFNVWHQYDKSVTELQHYFPHVGKMNIASCIQRCRGNVIASVKLLLERYPNEKPENELTWPVKTTLAQVRSGLEKVMVDRSKKDVAHVALGVIIDTDGQNMSIDQLVQIGVEHFLTFDISQVELEGRLRKMAEDSDMARAKAKSGEMPVIPEYLQMNNEGTYQEDDVDECRDMAMQLIFERNELFKKAAQAYRQAKNKGPGEGGVAFYYSDAARQIDAQAKDWNMRAARATVRSHRIKQKDDHLLDLHGLTVAEAQVVVREGVTQWFSRSQMQAARNQFRPLKIITGAGKHSQYGESKLLPSTLKLLKKEGWQYEMPQPGCIYVKGIRK